MRPIFDVMLTQKSNSAATANVKADSATVKQTQKIKRVSATELELAYLVDPIVFNGVNKIVETIMSANKKIKAKDKKIQKYYEDFLSNLGSSGSKITWDQLLTLIIKYQCIYGKAPIENILNKKGNRIVDWDILDPKHFDYAKDATQNIVLDDNNNPVGYFQLLNYGDLPKGSEDKLKQNSNNFPKYVTRPSGYPHSIFLEPNQVSLIKYSVIGDGFYPVGLVEPIYKASLRKLNVESSLASAMYRIGNPILMASLGDQNHEPTPNQIKGMLDKLKNLNSKNEVSVPYYYELSYLKPELSTEMKDNLEYFIDQEVSGLGIPKSFVTGGSENANAASLGNQSSMYSLTIKNLVRTTVEFIQKEMFSVIADYEGFSEVPVLEWDIDTVDEMNDKAKRLFQYAQSEFIRPSPETEVYLRKLEKLPPK